MKLLYFLLAISVVFLSCTKEKTTYTISGKVLQDCSGTPYSNKELSFFQRIGVDWMTQTSGGQLGTVKTDVNGRFSFTYSPQNENDIKIQAASSGSYSTVIMGVPGNENIDNLVVYYRPQTTIQVKLMVSKPYSANDTLYISDYRNLNFAKVSGPFTTGVLYNASGYPILNYYFHSESYQETLRYKIGNSSSWINKTFSLIPCDTSRVTVDIN